MKHLFFPLVILAASCTNPLSRYSPDPLFEKTWNNPDQLTELEIFELQPVEIKYDTGIQASGNNSVTASKDGDVRFDFGQVNAAWLEFECENLPEGCTCSISEFNEPAVFNLGSQSPAKTKEPVRYGNRYRLELNTELYEGVRYAWIHFKGIKEPVTVSNIHLKCQAKPVNYKGSFNSDDENLNRIWYTAAYTVRTNLMRDYFGAILMERSDRFSWTGDAHTSQAASMVVFGNYPFVRKNILNTSNQDNGILSYSILWVQSVVDYVMYSGDTFLADSLASNIQGKLRKAITNIRDGNNPSFYGWDERLGAGFENPGCDETRLAYKMLTIQTLRHYSGILPESEPFSEQCKFWADSLAASANGSQWGIFSASDAVNAGVIDGNAYASLWDTVYSDRLQRVSYSPFNEYFILNAMARMGRYPQALNTIDDCWGGQLRYGATTFFEVFRPSWNLCKLAQNDAPVNNQCGYTSLTHPWSAGVAKWLSEEILGVKPTSPGFATCTIEPHLCGKVSKVSGSVPTPKGLIKVDIDLKKGKCKVSIPSGVDARLILPDGSERSLSSGTERFRFKSVEPLQCDEGPLTYTYTEFSEDIETKGDWTGRYGSRGYMLFSYNGKGQNRSNITDIITLNKGGNCQYEDDTDDPRALVFDGRRAAGVYHTQDPIACQQTMTIDVDFSGSYTLSLYMLDWDHKNRRSAIELFDLGSKNLLAPVYMVRDYEDGKYVSIKLNQPVRVRIDQVRGDNAAVAGLFID